MGKQFATVGGIQFFDNSGDPLAGGKVYSYAAGTTTPLDTFQDAALLTPHANPIELDAYGRPPSNAIWLNGETKLVVKTSADATLYSLDNLNPEVSGLGGWSTKEDGVLTKSANYDLTAADDGKMVVATSGSWTLGTADAAATMGNGFVVDVLNSGSGTVTFNPNGSETVNYGNGAKSTMEIPPGASARIVCDGTNYQAWLKAGYRLRAVHEYTYDGTDIFIDGADQNNAANTTTWTKPEWCRAVRVRVQAPGGGAPYNNSAVGEAIAGAGGGGGGYSEKFITTGLGTTETITVGAVGAAGTVGTPDAGTGGTTSFGSHCSATGGAGGPAGTSGTAAGPNSTGGLGGTGSGGDINAAGSAGTAGLRFSASAAIGGSGGDSAMGGGGRGLQQGNAGAAGGNYGGGAGSGASANNSDQVGAVGGPAIVIVEEYE